jgi:hypothetical protein
MFYNFPIFGSRCFAIMTSLFLASCSFYDRDSHECTKDIIIKYEAAESIKESDLNFNSVAALKKLFSDNVTKDSAEFILSNIATRNQVSAEQLIASAFKDKAVGVINLYEEIEMQTPSSIKKLREAEIRIQKPIMAEALFVVLNGEGIPYAKKICNSDSFIEKIFHHFQEH